MDENILKYKEALISIALMYAPDLDLVEDVIFCGSRAGDWYEEDSDIDLALSLNKDFKYDPKKHWFSTIFKKYTVDIFLKSKNQIDTWRGLESPYYSFYTNTYHPGNPIDIQWLKKHKPILRKRKRNGKLQKPTT